MKTRLLTIGYLLALLVEPTLAAESGRHKAVRPTAPGEGRSETSETIAATSKRVFRLLVKSEDSVRSASAFLVSGKRIVATNHHVVEKAKAYVLGYVDAGGEVQRVGMKLVAAFPQKDLALLEAFSDLPGQALPLSADYPELASDLFAIGFPAAADHQAEGEGLRIEDPTIFSPSVLKGTVSRVLTGFWVTSQLQHQAPISHGYSGGPLVERGGVVVGISSAVHKDADGIAYGVAAVDLTRLLTACALPFRHTSVSVRVPTSATLINIANPKDEAAPEASPSDLALLERASDMLRWGDVARARAIFEYLVRKGVQSANRGLGKTYDPDVLSELKVVGISGDAAKARELYDAAGPNEIQARSFAGEAPKGCQKSLCAMFSQSLSTPTVVCKRPE